MKEFVIKKTSWHYKLLTTFNARPSESLCDYVWQIIGCFILLAIILLGAGVVCSAAFALGALATVTVTQNLSLEEVLFVIRHVTYWWNVNGILAAYTIVFLTAIVAVAAGFAYMMASFCRWLGSEPVSQVIDAFKGKVCVKVRVE